MSEQQTPSGLEPSGSRLSRDNPNFLPGDVQPKQPSAHQDKKKYGCPCGSSMSRSDVLLRHIRKCRQAQVVLERSGSTSRIPSRSKTACNECAAARLKCDSKNPCSRCTKKLLECEYTRQGYSDPYTVFRIRTTTSPILERDGEDAVEARRRQRQALNTLPEDAVVLPTPHTPSANSASASDQRDGRADGSSLAFNMNPLLGHANAPLLTGYGPHDLTDAFQDLDWNSLLSFQDWPATQAIATTAAAANTSTISLDFPDTGPLPKESAWNFTEGLHIQQVDSVEAKCVEIRNYISNFGTDIDHALLSMYVTRDRLVRCVQLYAKCYQCVQPILHLPTFDLTKTPPDLLASIMLVGACYSTSDIPPAVIVQGAIHLLLVLEYSSHETTMCAPPLASIQANALLCQLLILTHNPQAYHFATLHRARTISMAERAGLFSATDALNPWDLDESSFDWLAWSEMEMRKRLAYHIFVDDIGRNIFTRSTAHISPFTFHVETPCYNDCWVAPTASECFKKLQQASPPIQVAEAVKKLRSASSLQGDYLFAASDCGMLEIVVALHNVLYRVMEESLDNENIVPHDEHDSSADAGVHLAGLLNRDLLNYSVAKTANEIVSKYGSDSIRRANDAFDAWLRNWNARREVDMYDESHRAFTHPLNFWLLAKLFVVLHFYRNRYRPEAPESQPSPSSVLDTFYNSTSNGRAQSKLAIQMQVVGWLAKLRRQQEESLASSGSLLSAVLNI